MSSEEVMYKGKLIEVINEYNNLEDKILSLITEEDKKKFKENIKYYNDIFDYFVENYYDKFFIRNHKIYKIVFKKEKHCDIFKAKKMLDKSIIFTLNFHIGDYSFNKAMNIAIDKIEKEGK
jgi:hypothetical protein